MRALLTLSVFAFASLLAPAAERSFTVEQVMSAPFASSPIPAPTGSAVAWLMNEQGRRNLYVAAAPDWKGRKLTHFDTDDGQEIAELSWSPDGKFILFTRGGDFETGGDNPNPDFSLSKPEQSIWSVPLDGSTAKKLTEGHAPAISPKGDSVAFLRGGQIWMMKPAGEEPKNAVTQKATAAHMTWSPDGSRLAFTSDRHDHSFIGIYDPADKRLQYLDASVDRDSEPVWSPDGKHIAYLRTPSENRFTGFSGRREGEPWSIRVTDLDTGLGHEIFRAKPGPGSVYHRLDSDQQIFWGAGDNIVFAWERTGWNHLYSVSAGGEIARELTPGEGEVEHVALSADRKTMFYSTNIGDIDRRHIASVSVSGANAPMAVTGGETIEWAPAPASDGSALVFLSSSYNQRSHAEVRAGDGRRKALAPDTVPGEFPADQLVRPEAVMITAADGMRIHGQLFLPRNERQGDRHPALIFFHGGSRREMLLGFHYMDYYSNAYAMNQFLANHGYVVLSVNYRSGIGYGLNFREAINYGIHGASEYNDVIGAGLFLKNRADVDAKRIGVWGGSYGGYLTAMALSRSPELFAAGVDFHGVHDWSTLRTFNIFPGGGNPQDLKEQEEAARIAFQSSPMASVENWKAPVLLIHGDDDRNVNFSQTVMLVHALRKQHVEFEELIIPNEIHGFLMHQHWLEAYKATADFFARKLQSPSEMAQRH